MNKSPKPEAHQLTNTHTAVRGLPRLNCGACLMERVDIVPLDRFGVCTKCGADYSNVVERNHYES